MKRYTCLNIIPQFLTFFHRLSFQESLIRDLVI